MQQAVIAESNVDAARFVAVQVCKLLFSSLGTFIAHLHNMARILITGSSDGLGSLTARALVKRGHSVVLHARNDKRAQDARSACPEAETCIVADLSDISQDEEDGRRCE